MTPGIRVLTPVFVLLVSVAMGQPPTLDVTGTAVGNYGSIKFTDPATVGKKIVPDVAYEDVRGRYMWDDEWHPGYLILKGGNKYALNKIKLNLHSQQVHYVGPDGVELAADNMLVRQVVLFKTDSTQMLATFFAIKAGAAKTNEWYQQMNAGKTQLLKKAATHINKLPYDPSVGKTEYRFVTETQYYLLVEQQVKPLGSLNKSSVSSVVTLDGAADEWLGAHKNKLRSEGDIIAFLDYYNAR
jgi:hypothetical protein